MFGPGVPFYLTYFYSRERVGFRHGVFISGAAAANAYGGALAYGISQIRGSVAPWKILFIIEGVPTCLLAIIAWYFIPDSIDGCKFLTAEEKVKVKAFVARGQISDEGEHKTGLRFKQLVEAFKDPKSYIPAVRDTIACLQRNSANCYAAHVFLLQCQLCESSAILADHH